MTIKHQTAGQHIQLPQVARPLPLEPIIPPHVGTNVHYKVACLYFAKLPRIIVKNHSKRCHAVGK